MVHSHWVSYINKPYIFKTYFIFWQFWNFSTRKKEKLFIISSQVNNNTVALKVTFLCHFTKKLANSTGKHTSGVAFGNKAGKLPILTNVKYCSCLFYKFSPLSDSNNKMHNYNSSSWGMIYYKVAWCGFETTNCLRLCIERLFA
jgi:hypothetical protein